MKRAIVAAALILGGMLNAAEADTWVFRDNSELGKRPPAAAPTCHGHFRDGAKPRETIGEGSRRTVRYFSGRKR